MVRLTRNNKNNTNAKKRGILRLLSALARYIKHKVESAYKKLVKKEPKKTFTAPNILENEVYNEENLKRKSIDELKEIVKLRGIKSRCKLKKESLITSILKSEISNVERNCMKYFNANASNNNINVSNITNASNNTNVNTTNDDTYGGKIRDKKGDIRMILSRMGDIVPKNDRENSMK